MVFKTTYKFAPGYLLQLLSPRRRATFGLTKLDRKVTSPKPRSNYLKRSFSRYSGAPLKNNLRQEVRGTCSMGQLKRKLHPNYESDSNNAIM